MYHTVSRLLSFNFCFLSVNFFNTILFEPPVFRRHQGILPLPLVLMTITQISEKWRCLFVFTSCFNFLKSKVNPVVVPTKLGSRLFFFGVTLLGRAGVGTVPHFPFSCLAVLLAFLFNCVFPHCRLLLHHCSCLPTQEPYNTFACLSSTLWSTSVFVFCYGLLPHCRNHLQWPH